MRALALCLLLLSACATAARPRPLSWPAPPGWKSETIPFPLDFAPGIRHGGVEELRFSPGFGRPDGPLYFTYAFLWLLPPGDSVDGAGLARDLRLYFDGLMGAVAHSKGRSQAVPAARVEVAARPAGRGGAPAFTARVESIDAFFTGGPLQLELRIDVLPRPGHGSVVYFEASPRLGTTPVEEALAELRRRLAPL